MAQNSHLKEGLEADSSGNNNHHNECANYTGKFILAAICSRMAEFDCRFNIVRNASGIEWLGQAERQKLSSACIIA